MPKEIKRKKGRKIEKPPKNETVADFINRRFGELAALEDETVQYEKLSRAEKERIAMEDESETAGERD